ncbi:MAG TPA: phage protease, partial [Elusimicrobiales bacterium]|nr:phage protease [Elusimicrobiales bacterium]
VTWTDKARQYLEKREYRYLSAVFLVNKAGRVMRFINAALTNAPAVDGMVPIVNKSQIAAGGETASDKEEGQNMEQILKALGLAAAATVEDALAAIEALKNAGEQVACKDVLAALGLKDSATKSEVTGTIMAMKAGSGETASLAGKVKELTEKIAKRDAEDMVQMAMKDGKVTPAMKDWALKTATADPEGFKVFVAKAPVMVPGETLPPNPPPDGQPTPLNETELMVCKQTGISPEEFRKHNKEGN